jgi:hypothetical protein
MGVGDRGGKRRESLGEELVCGWFSIIFHRRLIDFA